MKIVPRIILISKFGCKHINSTEIMYVVPPAASRGLGWPRTAWTTTGPKALGRVRRRRLRLAVNTRARQFQRLL